IFTGQIAAALAAGNAVVAKPAEQTPLVAAAAVRHLLSAGIPGDVLHLLPGTGETVGAALVADPRIAGVALTRPTEHAPARHAARMAREGRLLYACKLPPGTEHGSFFAPRAFEIDTAGRLDREVFGPILHVVRWRADSLDTVLDEIAATGYALTLGIHSRIDQTVRHILARLGVGNSYVNRTMIGAVVGAQPFGGERLSGTGPKAGGPRYLHRFATERT